MLIFSIVSITLALLFYTVAVWSEKFAGELKKWHLGLFWIGLCFDTLGTIMMEKMSKGIKLNLHGITGALAILLMLFHAVWATIVLLRKNKESIMNFHKFSLFVWFIWLIPYLTGMMLNIVK
ncbi:TIGR03987 family protein [Crassaminicella thermophila]|uniref:TIGR03987 family protein n=1 Tax=Crassaminicella thermophila TaxID=2599308 RepID=A0A5C0SG15_CRATE|nr:HsmA family protein [Crassaminicella thermophila]QEK12686.1 TIGR03987 family protein [Crassaminicella thermophila]